MKIQHLWISKMRQTFNDGRINSFVWNYRVWYSLGVGDVTKKSTEIQKMLKRGYHVFCLPIIFDIFQVWWWQINQGMSNYMYLCGLTDVTKLFFFLQLQEGSPDTIFKKGVRISICNVFNALNDFKPKFECLLTSYKWDTELTILCYVNQPLDM